jgi:hypothetical protein
VEVPTVKEDYEFYIPARVVGQIDGHEVSGVEVTYHATGSAIAQVNLTTTEKDGLKVVDGQTYLVCRPLGW